MIWDGVLRDVYWTYSYGPTFDDSGRTKGVLVTCQDVTDAYISGQRLARGTEELTEVLDTITNGFLVLDKEGRYTYFNEQGASTIGMRRDDLITVEHFAERTRSRPSPSDSKAACSTASVHPHSWGLFSLQELAKVFGLTQCASLRQQLW